MFKLKNKFAFTLAETLITLTLIGVVAAITIPVVSGNFHEKVVVTQVKRFHENMSQLLQDAISENYGRPVSEWDYEKGKPDKLMKYFEHHLSISQDCGFDTDCLWTGMYKKLNGEDQVTYGASNSYYKLILADGSHMWFRTHAYTDKNCGDTDGGFGYAQSLNPAEKVCAMFWYDINGKKGPNVIGKDTFVFVLVEDENTQINKFAPYHSFDLQTNCSTSGNGFACAEKAISQGKLYR